jgi:hypothetical protein
MPMFLSNFVIAHKGVVLQFFEKIRMLPSGIFKTGIVPLRIENGKRSGHEVPLVVRNALSVF